MGVKEEDVLNRIVDYLKSKDIEYASISDDGRINSSIDERTIIEELLTFFSKDKTMVGNGYELQIPKMREWYDFIITNENDYDFFLPVNIKVTAMSTDNLNCKLGIYFALTGMLPTNISNEVVWDKFFIELHNNINKRTDRDYYFLVANKKKKNDLFWNSLKMLRALVPNGNNLPFQSNWSTNRERVKRTHEESGEFILECFKQSIIRRTTIRDHFEKFIEPHLKEYKNKNGSVS